MRNRDEIANDLMDAIQDTLYDEITALIKDLVLQVEGLVWEHLTELPEVNDD